MAITFVAGQEETTNPAGSPHTLAVNTGTRTNGLFVWTVYMQTSNVLTLGAPTYAGNAMTEAIHYNPAGNQHLYIFFQETPDDGSDDLSYTWSIIGGGGWQKHYSVCSWYDGGNQTAAEDQTNSGTGGTDPSLTITPGENNELIVSVYDSSANNVLAPTAPHATIHNHDYGGTVDGTGYTIQTTAQEETVAYTGQDGTWYMALASFKEVAAAGGRTTLNTDTYGLGIESGMSRTFKVHS